MRVTMMAMLLASNGCDQNDSPVKTKANATVALKAQRESLEKAKNVERMVLDAAVQQKEAIEAGSQ
jgi:hypothetical protein